MWHTFDQGRSLGTRGTEDGIIVLDEEHERGARITLEQGGRNAPWSLTCGICGCFMHVAFASSEDEANRKYSDMKRDLVEIMEASSSSPCYEKMRLFTDLY